MKLTYWGHSCFLIENGRHVLLIDPFLTGNPKAPVSAAQVRCDYILLSHGHNDHLGDAIDIARRTKAMVISNHEIVTYCGKYGVAGHGMNTGGAHHLPFGRVKMTPAWHSSAYETEEGFLYMGNPMGMLITMDAKTVYHAGDTALFGDMKLIGDMHKIDVALLPIGDNYTMGIDDAVKAVEFLHPRLTIPMHYNTFEAITCDPQEFVKKCLAVGAEVKIVEPGESFEF